MNTLTDAQQKFYRLHRRGVTMSPREYGKKLYLKHKEEIEQLVRVKHGLTISDQELEQLCKEALFKSMLCITSTVKEGAEVFWGKKSGTARGRLQPQHNMYFKTAYKPKVWTNKKKVPK